MGVSMHERKAVTKQLARRNGKAEKGQILTEPCDLTSWTHRPARRAMLAAGRVAAPGKTWPPVRVYDDGVIVALEGSGALRMARAGSGSRRSLTNSSPRWTSRRAGLGSARAASARRAVVALQERFGVSERRACGVAGQHRSTHRLPVRPVRLRRRSFAGGCGRSLARIRGGGGSGLINSCVVKAVRSTGSARSVYGVKKGSAGRRLSKGCRCGYAHHGQPSPMANVGVIVPSEEYPTWEMLSEPRNR